MRHVSHVPRLHTTHGQIQRLKDLESARLFGEYYVDVGAHTGGIGSIARPFARIESAIAKIQDQPIPFARITLAPGFYVFTEPVVTVPEGVLVVIEGAINGITILGDFNWTSTGDFLNPGPAGASALAFRNVTVGRVSISDGTTPGISPLVYENCFFGEVDADGLVATIDVPISGVSTAAFSIDSPHVSSVALGPIATSGNVLFSNTRLTPLCTGVSAKGVFAQFCAFFQSLSIADVFCELHGCLWGADGLEVEFSGDPGTLRIDPYSNYYFKGSSASLINGTKIVTADMVP